VQAALRPPAPGKAEEVGDRQEAVATTTALATAAVPPVSLSTTSPLLAEAAKEAPLGKEAGFGDREEAEATAFALATSAAVQPASLSERSPPLATATTKSSVPGKAEDFRAGAGATTAALTSAGVQQVSPSTPPSPLPDDRTIKGSNYGKWSTVAGTSRYQELISERHEALRSQGLLTEHQAQGCELLLKFAEEHKEKLLRRDARGARRKGQGKEAEDRPEQQSAESKRAG